MKISRRFKEGIIGGLGGFLGPSIGFVIYYLLYGYYIYSWTHVIIFSVISLIVSVILVFALKKSFFL